MWFIFKPCSTLLTSVFVFVLNCIQLPRLHQSSLRAADGSAAYREREYVCVCVCGLITMLVWTTDKRIIYPARDRRFVIGRRIRCIAFGVTSGLPASLHRRTYTCSVFVSLNLLLLQTDDTGVSGRAVKSWVCASVHGCVCLCQLSSLYVLWPVGFVFCFFFCCFFLCVMWQKELWGNGALCAVLTYVCLCVYSADRPCGIFFFSHLKLTPTHSSSQSLSSFFPSPPLCLKICVLLLPLFLVLSLSFQDHILFMSLCHRLSLSCF